MPETTPLIKAALNLRVGAGFDVYVLYLYVEQFVHVGLPFVHRGIEKIKYSVILSTYHGKQIKLSVIVRQLRRGGGENDGQ